MKPHELTDQPLKIKSMKSINRKNYGKRFPGLERLNQLILVAFIAFASTFGALAQLGTIDGDFVLGTGFGTGALEARVESIVQQPDGKLLVGGWFTDYNGTAVNRLVRLNLDGSIDNTFNIGNGIDGFSAYVKAIALQADGKILIGGNFLEFDGTTRHRIARLTSNGSLDESFDPLTGFNSDVNSIAVQPDGKIIVAGIFTAYDWLNNGGIACPRIARLQSDGSLDDSFSPTPNAFLPVLGFGQARVHKVLLQADGKILACGLFDDFDGVTRTIAARLNADGSLDTSFDPGDNFQINFGFYGESWDMKLQPDGKVIIAGNFSHTGSNNSGVVRLNSDGSLDESFSITKKATSIGLQADGKVIVAESGPYNVNRHNADGSLDAAFPQTSLSDVAQTIVLQEDGNILLGGWFTYNPSGIMRLIGDNSTIDIAEAEGDAFALKLFPNPASENVVISNIPPKAQIRISDLTGNLVLERRSNSSLEELNVSEWKSGVYLITLISNGRTIQKRLVVDH